MLTDRVADRYLRPTVGISVSMFAALVTIDAIGPTRQSELARRLDVSRSAVTQRLVALVDRGLIVISPDGDDQRAKNVAITDAGRNVLHQAWQGLAESDDGIERGIDVPLLLEQLERFIANAERYLGIKEHGSVTATDVIDTEAPEVAQ